MGRSERSVQIKRGVKPLSHTIRGENTLKDFIKYIIAAALAIGFAGIFYFNSLKLPPVAKKLPTILMAIIVLLAVGMAIEAFYKCKKEEASITEADTIEKASPDINYLRVFIFTLMIAVYIFTIKPLGYFIVTPIFIAAAYLYLKSTSKANIILISLGFTVFVYLVFIKFLKLPIPLGPMS